MTEDSIPWKRILSVGVASIPISAGLALLTVFGFDALNNITDGIAAFLLMAVSFAGASFFSPSIVTGLYERITGNDIVDGKNLALTSIGIFAVVAIDNLAALSLGTPSITGKTLGFWIENLPLTSLLLVPVLISVGVQLVELKVDIMEMVQ